MFLSLLNNPIFIGVVCVIVIIILIIGIIIITKRPTPKTNNWADNIQREFIKNNIEYKLCKSNQSFYDYDLNINDKSYLIKLLYVPSYSEVQINNVTTWEIKFGAGKNPGRVQPFKKLATGIEDFMNHKPDGKTIKVVVVSPNAKKITKYINECEIVFVDYKTNVYGTRVINEDDYALFC